MTIKKYIFVKKIKDKGQASSPEARAFRLRKVRNMANLTRKAMTEKYDLNVNTYKGWEIARFGGLPLDGAKKVINRVAEEGVICTLNWLLYGEGKSPTISLDVSNIDNNQPEANIFQEIFLYKSLNKDIIFTEIMDDGMVPIYHQGDYVAGEKRYSSNIIDLIDQDCIIQLYDGSIMVRKLKKGSEKESYNLACTNTRSQTEKIIIYNIKLQCAAYISRHYKINTTYS
jgi:DNA-binding XRE family transcriptional regulator